MTLGLTMINIDLNKLNISNIFKIQSIRDEVADYINDPYANEESNDFYYTMTNIDIYNGYGQKITSLQILSDDDMNHVARQERISLHEFDDFKALMGKCNPSEIASFLANNGYYVENEATHVTIEYIAEDNPRIVFTKH